MMYMLLSSASLPLLTQETRKMNTRSPPHGVIRGSALCSDENSGPGIRLRNFFVERGGGKVGRWTVFSALSGW
eukprot:407151-Prorocentrum_minimum.AAC.2